MRRFRRRRRAFRHINRLRSAHQLYDMGNFFDAAVVFEELASLAESRSRPRAPQLLLQAGRAYAKAGEHKTGYDLLLRGLRLMAERGQQRRLIATSARILRAMEGQGDHKQATKLKRAIDQLMDEYGLEIPPTSPSPARPKLPPKCPQCGGSVHPDEVKWHSDQTAVCVYCGSILEPQL